MKQAHSQIFWEEMNEISGGKEIMKILGLASLIFLLIVVGAVCYDLGGNGQVHSSQASLRDEGVPINPATITDTFPRGNIPYKEGYDPETGKPIKSGQEGTPQSQNYETPSPQAYGAPPSQEFYPKMSNGYPYLAKMPAGAEGKVQVTYNYVVEFAQRYLVEIKVINNSNQTLEKFYYDEFLKDGSGNILNEIRNEGHHNYPPYFPLQPGESIILKTCRTSVPPGFGGLTSFNAWKVEMEITYLKLN